MATSPHSSRAEISIRRKCRTIPVKSCCLDKENGDTNSLSSLSNVSLIFDDPSSVGDQSSKVDTRSDLASVALNGNDSARSDATLINIQLRIPDNVDAENLGTNLDDEHKSAEKLTRRGSFTVETPSFADLPVIHEESQIFADKNEQKNFAINFCDSNGLPSTSMTSQKHLEFWNMFEQFPANDYSNVKPSAAHGDDVGPRGDYSRILPLENCNVNDIQTQIERLTHISFTMDEYHRLQFENMRMRQKREKQTLLTQIDYMREILRKLHLNSSFCSESKRKISPVALTDSLNLRSFAAEIVENDLCSETPVHRLLRNVEKRKLAVTAIKSIIKRENSNSRNQSQTSKATISSNCITASPTELATNPSDYVPEVRINHKHYAHFVNLNEIPPIIVQKLGQIVRGYLTRRYFKVTKIEMMASRIRDMQKQLSDLNREDELSESEHQFAENLSYQLRITKEEFYKTVLGTTLVEKLNFISEDRSIKRRRDRKLKKMSTEFENSKKISLATIKRLASRNSAPDTSTIIDNKSPRKKSPSTVTYVIRRRSTKLARQSPKNPKQNGSSFGAHLLKKPANSPARRSPRKNATSSYASTYASSYFLRSRKSTIGHDVTALNNDGKTTYIHDDTDSSKKLTTPKTINNLANKRKPLKSSDARRSNASSLFTSSSKFSQKPWR